MPVEGGSMRLTLRLIGTVGVVLFGAILALSYVSPIHVERTARGFIENQIERQVVAELGLAPRQAQATQTSRLAEVLTERNAAQIGALRARIASGLHAQIAATVARMQDLDCECRKQLQRGLDTAAELRISTLERAQPQLQRMVEGRYSDIVADLMRDVRIFAAANLLAFLPLLALAAVRPGRLRELFVPAILLAAAAMTASGFYLFAQNWFFTLLYADYLGWTYGIWLLLIFALFCDIALFKAKITARIIDALFSIIGKAPIPC